MAVNKCFSSQSYQNIGVAFAKYAAGTGTAVDRLATNGQPRTFDPSGNFNGRFDSYAASWSNGTGTTINTTGSVLFNNDLNGGSLSTIIVANNGGATAYVGFNSSIPIVGSGFPLSSGQSMEYKGYISEMWAITNSSTTIINAQGLFNYSRDVLNNK